MLRNTTTVHTMLREAVQRRSHLVLLPELWRTGYGWENYQHTAEQVEQWHLHGDVATGTATSGQHHRFLF
ncbi:MAG UNVERIFIED_CONTAM: hypothetical protein LVT10_16050 [Anaerolineae bacterium]